MTAYSRLAQSLTCLLFLFVVTLAPVAAQEGGILILQSRYGSDSNGCDPTGTLSRSCTGKADCSVVAGNALCGDPHPGINKRLRVSFRCGRNGADRIVEAAEDQQLRMTCTTIKVQAVVYGQESSFCDATAAVAAQCDREERCSLSPGNHFCGDPAPGLQKVAHVIFKCNDAQRFATVAEHTSGLLACD